MKWRCIVFKPVKKKKKTISKERERATMVMPDDKTRVAMKTAVTLTKGATMAMPERQQGWR